MLYYCLTDFRLVMFIILLFLWKRKMVTYSVWVTRLYSNSNLQATVHFPNLNFKTLQFLGRGIEPWLFQKLTRAKQSWRMLSRHRMWWVMHINQSIPQVTFTCTSHLMQHNESLPERAAPWDSVWRGVGWGKEIKKILISLVWEVTIEYPNQVSGVSSNSPERRRYHVSTNTSSLLWH